MKTKADAFAAIAHFESVRMLLMGGMATVAELDDAAEAAEAIIEAVYPEQPEGVRNAVACTEYRITESGGK